LKNKNKKPRHYRLKAEFILAIVVSFIIASLGMIIIGSIYESFPKKKYEKQLEKIDIEIDTIFTEIETYIKENKISQHNKKLLDQKIKQYTKYVIQVEMLRKDDIEMLLEGEYEPWPIYQYRYVVTDDDIFILAVQLDPLGQYYIILSIVFIIGFIILFVVSLSYFISRKQKYLRKIGNGLDILEGGTLDHQVPIKGNDEITDVARHINQMSKALKSRIDKEKLDEQAKNQLIANLSHDLRTPLTSITGYLTLLKDNYDNKGDINPQYLDICLNKSTALGDLIEQLFEYVMLSNGQMQLHSSPVHISRYVSQTCYEWASLLEDQHLNLQFQVDECDKEYLIDVDKFNRVMENLFKNILKYAHPDKDILLTTYDYESGYRIEISNGIKDGIELSEKDIFNRFFTSDRTMESAGIGLAICKEIISMHKGEIEAHIDGGRFTIGIDLFQD